MAEIKFHIKLAPEVRARRYTLVGDRSEFWTARIDDQKLTPIRREHLLRMANSIAPATLPFYTLPFSYFDDVYATEYKPIPDQARFARQPHAVSDANEADAEVIALILENADALAVVNAAIAADYDRWIAANHEAFRRLDEMVDVWINDTKKRIAELRDIGADALTKRDVEWNIRPQKPGWLDAVVANDQLGERVADLWRELTEAHDAALAEARCRLDERRTLEEKRQRVAQAEARVWIEEFGSDRLRELVRSRYPFWREYLKERTNVEYPGFHPDIDNLVEYHELDWDDKPPTAEQIEFAKRSGGRVVIMTRDWDGVYRNKVPVVIVEKAFHGIDLLAYNW